MINVLAFLIHYTIHGYIIVILIRSVISWVGTIPPNKFIILLRKITDPVFRFVHKHVPYTVVGNVDISPIYIVIALLLLDRVILELLAGLAVNTVNPGTPQPGTYPN